MISLQVDNIWGSDVPAGHIDTMRSTQTTHINVIAVQVCDCAYLFEQYKYGRGRGVAYRVLRNAGFSVNDSKALVRYADEYFLGQLGMNLNSVTRIPGNRRG